MPEKRKPPPRARVQKLETVAGKGDRLATLEVLRQRLARAIDGDPSPRDLAALSQRLELVLTEIEKLTGTGAKGSPSDELRNRRSARAAKARGRTRP